MKKRIIWFAVLVLLLVYIGTVMLGPKEGAGENSRLLIFAAASMSDTLKEIADKFTAENPGVYIDFSWGSSGALQMQIEQGAPAEIFISAGKKQVDTLVQKDLILPGSVYQIARNQLVVVGAKDGMFKVNQLADLLSDKITDIGIGDPATVPAGQYSYETLVNASIYDAVKGKLIYGNDVRQVLQYVETGEVDLGLVYATDVHSAKKVKIFYAIPESLHKPIIYPAGIVKTTENLELARKFLDYLRSQEGLGIMQKYGFLAGDNGD